MKQRIYEPMAGAVGIGAVEHGSAPEWRRGKSGEEGILDAAVRLGFTGAEILGKEYRARREAEVEDLAAEAARRFELWKAEYEQTNQGSLGLSASADYGRKFDEFAKQARQKLGAGRDGIFGEMLDRKLTERGLFALRDGAQFAARQREVWLQSRYQSSQDEYLAYAGAHPEDTQGIQFKRNQVLRQLVELKPGQDLGALIAQLDRQTLETRLLALEAAGDFDGMERLLGARQRLLDAGLTDKSALGTWAAAHNNPGCVTTDGENMAMFATPEEGVAAIMERSQSYARKGLNTISKIMHKYAPPEQNDTKAYIAFVCKQTGIGPHDKVDTKDPRFLKAFAKAVARKENSLNLPDDLVDRGYQFLVEHGKPKFAGQIPWRREGRLALLASGLPPEKTLRFQQSIEAGRKRGQDEALQNQVLQWGEQLEAMPKMMHAQAIEEWTGNLPPAQKLAARNALYDFAFKRDNQERRGEELKEKAKARGEKAVAEAHIGQMLGLPEEERAKYAEAVTAGANDEDSRKLRQALYAASRERSEQERASWRYGWQRAFDSALAETGEADGENRLHGLAQAYARDSAEADEMLEYGKRFLDRRKKAREASEQSLFAQLEPLRESGDMEGLRAALASAIREGRLSAAGAKRANELFFGPASAETEKNVNALRDARVMITNGALQTEEARREYARINKLTLGQQKELLAFQGYDANSNYNRLASAGKLYGFKNFTPRQLEILSGLLPRDRDPTDRDIQELLVAASTRDDSFLGLFSNTALDELMRDQPLESWLPKLEDYEIPKLEAMLKALGQNPSTHNMQVLKLRQLSKTLKVKVNVDFEE